MIKYKKEDNPLVYNSLKVCGTLTDPNFETLAALIKQALAKTTLDYDSARAIKEIAPILIDGPPSQLNYPFFLYVWQAKEPLIHMLADQIPRPFGEAMNDFLDNFKRHI